MIAMLANRFQVCVHTLGEAEQGTLLVEHFYNPTHCVL